MIELLNVSVIHENDIAKLESELIVNGIKKKCFFKVNAEYANFLSVDRSDCFIVAFLYLAVRENMNIVSKIPISASLYYQINVFLLPLLSKMFNTKISLDVGIIDDLVDNNAAVGTGITCGIDSLYSVITHKDILPNNFKLSHLALFNVGSHSIGEEKETLLYSQRKENAKSFCNKFGFKFIEISSNIHTFLPYHYTNYYCLINCSAVLSVQKLFSYYYSSSSYSIEQFEINSNDLSHFELFILNMLSTKSLRFYSVGGELNRFEKTKVLANNKEAYSYLNVCNLYGVNCGKCIKCLRTLYALDILNVLDQYRDVFDIDDYIVNRNKYIAKAGVRRYLARDPFIYEIWTDLMKKYSLQKRLFIIESIKFIKSRISIYSFQDIKQRLK